MEHKQNGSKESNVDKYTVQTGNFEEVEGKSLFFSLCLMDRSLRKSAQARVSLMHAMPCPFSKRATTDNTQGVDDEKTENPEPIYISAIYGVINSIICLPVLMSFGTVIYSHQAYAPYVQLLVKLTVISSAVHQLCFSAFSSLPFAVGQVQDAGLIFLSAMASDIVEFCRSREDISSDENVLATATILLPLCTALLGIGLVLVSKAKLAQYVQLLPTPVIGGYLAYIGFFCGQSGLALMARVHVEGIADWYKFVIHVDAFVHMLPGLLGGVAIYFLVRTLRHMCVLPCCILALIVGFYAMLHLVGDSVEEASDHGWISQSDDPTDWYRIWDYLRFDKVAWAVIPSLLTKQISMIFVVALSSSLDIAAIELELGSPLNYNHEIKTVGISNIVSGLTGGYTGSYIFSQSIFSLRAGIKSRVNGVVISVIEIMVVFLPFSISSYVPNFLFGSLLVMICVDLMNDWLWDVRKEMTRTEYLITLLCFVLIQLLGVAYGIMGALFIYLICWKLGMNVKGFDRSNMHAAVEVDEESGWDQESDPATANYGSIN